MHDDTSDEAVAELVAQPGQGAAVGLRDVVGGLDLDADDGAVGPFEHEVDLASVARLRTAEPEAFAAGAALDLPEAVAFARRSRGQRGRPVAGWASLTPTERQVAELAAGGRPNAEIARDLLMSPATVKTHLTRIFGKVGVRNRTELAAAHRAAC